ncbi:MAG: hypothetical protein ABIC04_00940 [Nanoarchaeota archaeon]
MVRKQRVKHVNVPLIDVEGIIPFNKKETNDPKSELTEEQRIKKEITSFISKLQKNMHEPLCYIGEEKRYGKHLERFMFSGSGFMEIMVEAPLTINAHFTHVSVAHKYANALKKTLREILPNTKIKELFLDSISVDEEGAEQLTYEKWDRMHHMLLHKSIVITVVTLMIIIIFEGIKALVAEISVEIAHVSSLVVPIVAAIIIALLFEPLIKKTEHLVNKFMIK